MDLKPGMTLTGPDGSTYYVMCRARRIEDGWIMSVKNVHGSRYKRMMDHTITDEFLSTP